MMHSSQSRCALLLIASGLSACLLPADDESSADLEIEEKRAELDSLTNETALAVIDPELDLATRIAARRATGEVPLVPLAPKLVVGEGAAPNNHTIVRILNGAGIAELSFLAYPYNVLGGVSVNTGTMSSQRVIVTAPLAGNGTRSIRLFNEKGILVGSFTPSSTLLGPFAIAVGDFSAGSAGDEIAIASRNTQAAGPRAVEIRSGNGVLLQSLSIPQAALDSVVISTIHTASNDLIAATFQSTKSTYVVDPATLELFHYPAPALQSAGGMFESAFDQDLMVGGGQESIVSNLTRMNFSGATSSVNAGARENKVWVTAFEFPETGTMKKGRLALHQTAMQTAAYAAPEPPNSCCFTGGATPCNERPPPDFYNTDVAFWSQVDDFGDAYETQLPAVWTVFGGHRHRHEFCGMAHWWREELDPSTGLPRFIALSRNNAPATEQNGSDYFDVFTYASEPTLDRLNVYPMRTFLRDLAVHYRALPERLIGVEPVHESEVAISIPNDGTIGDYNPRMITDFRDHLLRLYGSLTRINQRFGTNFTTLTVNRNLQGAFDAPRALTPTRGSWDTYSVSNHYFKAWVQYQRRAVNRHTSRASAEAMLAGFPAELIKTHQIAVPSPFVDQLTRLPPMDWTFSSGTGAGESSYGIFFNTSGNWLASARSSGQRNLTVGEYQGWTYSLSDAQGQLNYMFNNGVQFIQNMGWQNPAAFQTIQEQALASFTTRTDPRPGAAGGIGEVRAVSALQLNGSRKPYNIVSLSRGAGGSGLLKSIQQNGDFEGSVYTQPFHAHVDISPITFAASKTISTVEYDSGNIAGLDAGDQIEVSFRARTNNANGKMTLVVLHDGSELPQFRRVFAVGGTDQSYRWILRNQFPLDAIKILINSGERDTPTGNAQTIVFSDFSVVKHRERISHVDAGLSDGVAHSGGVTFDVLSADFVPQATVPASFIGGRASFALTHAGLPMVAGGWNSMLPQTSISYNSPTLGYQLIQGSNLTHPSYAGSGFAVPAGKRIYKVTFDYMSVYDNALVVGGVMIPNNAVFWTANQWGHNFGSASLLIPHTDWIAFGLSTKASFNVAAPNWMFHVSNAQVFYH
jgi:hypothetical protein